MEKGPSGEATS